MRARRMGTSTVTAGRAVVAGGLALTVALGLARVTAFEAAGDAGQATSGAHDRPGAHGRLAKGAVWVVNRDLGGSLAVFDAATGDVAAFLPSIGAGAHDICLSAQTGKAYVMAETINAVIVVDVETLEKDMIPVAPLPHHCEVSPDGRTLYVSLSAHTAAPGAPQLAVIDLENHGVAYVATSANVAARAHGPATSAHGDTLHVAHDIGNEVTSVDLGSQTVGLSVTPILRAEEVVATRSGQWLWASSRGDGSVKRIDARTGAFTAVEDVGVEPESVMLTPSERVLAVSLRGSPLVPAVATLAFVDTREMSLMASVALAPVESCGAVAHAPSFGDLAVMSPDGHYVYATFDRTASCRGGVSVVDVHTQQVVATWPYPGLGRPHGVAFTRKQPRF